MEPAILIGFVLPLIVAVLGCGVWITTLIIRRRAEIRPVAPEFTDVWEEMRALRGELETAQRTASEAKDEASDAKREAKDMTAKYERVLADQELERARQRRRDQAIINVLKDVARQWTGAEPPRFNTNDLSEIEDTIPREWLPNFGGRRIPPERKPA